MDSIFASQSQAGKYLRKESIPFREGFFSFLLGYSIQLM